MELQSLLILFGISAAASMDSFSAVLAYSAAGIHIPPRSVWTLGLVSGGLLGLSVLAGSRLGALGAVAQIAGAVLLILLGAGNLGKAIVGSLDFEGSGFDLMAIFDTNEWVVGSEIREYPVISTDKLEDFCHEHHPEAAILCIPQEGAELLVPQLVELGVRSFLNFSHYDIDIEFSNVAVENVYIADSLMTLSYRAAALEEEQE